MPDESHDDDLLAFLYQMGGGTVHSDYPAERRGRDDICFEPRSGAIARDKHPLSGPEAGAFEQVEVDRNTSHIAKVSLSDGGLMNFRA